MPWILMGCERRMSLFGAYGTERTWPAVAQSKNWMKSRPRSNRCERPMPTKGKGSHPKYFDMYSKKRNAEDIAGSVWKQVRWSISSRRGGYTPVLDSNIASLLDPTRKMQIAYS